jgi:hypothetical protein
MMDVESVSELMHEPTKPSRLGCQVFVRSILRKKLD